MLAIYSHPHSFFSFIDLFTAQFLLFGVNLIKPFFCLKSMLIIVLIIISLLTIPFNSTYALNITTANAIHGGAPYLTYDGGTTKADSTESLLSITLSDGTVISAENDESSLTNPIELPNQGDTYASIQTIVPLPQSGNSNYPKVKMTDLLKAPYNYFGDDDGDGYDDVAGEVIATASGDIGVKWENINGIDVTDTVKNNAYSKFIECDGPYKLTITATNGELKTQYGEPNKSSFMGGSHSYYINPKVEPHVCYAQPSPLFDDAARIGSHEGVSPWFDGPGWDSGVIDFGEYRGYPSKGFKFYNARNSGHYDGKNSVYTNNFPSTGSNGLYFYLLLAGISPEAVIAANGSSISAVEGGNVRLSLSTGITGWEHQLRGLISVSDEYPYLYPYGVPQKALKITLNGPRATSNDKNFSPSTFRLYADRGKSKILYEFKLMRWYIPTHIVYQNVITKENISMYQAKGQEECQRLGKGYRLTEMNDLTHDIFWESVAHWGGTPSNYPNPIIMTDTNARRQLSYREDGKWISGIINEWGCLYNNSRSDCRNYPDNDWLHDYYLIATSKTVKVGLGKQRRELTSLSVDMQSGGVGFARDTAVGNYYISCVSP